MTKIVLDDGTGHMADQKTLATLIKAGVTHIIDQAAHWPEGKQVAALLGVAGNCTVEEVTKTLSDMAGIYERHNIARILGNHLLEGMGEEPIEG